MRKNLNHSTRRIILYGTLVAVAIFMFADIPDVAQVRILQNIQWTQNVNGAMAVPACISSSNGNPTCSGNSPRATINWSGPFRGRLHLKICYNPDPCDFNGTVDNQEFTYSPGSYTTAPGVLANNTAYNYRIADTSEQTWPVGTFSTPNCAPPLPPTASISADSTFIVYNTATVVHWSSTNATSCTVSPPGWTGTSGAQSTGNLTSATTYTLNCSGHGGSASNSVTVNIQPPGGFSLSLGGAVACNSIPLSWTVSSSASAYRIFKNSIDISPYQPYTSLNFTDSSVTQHTGYTYQVQAYNGAGSTLSNTINVTTPYCPPTINFSGNPPTIYQGQQTTLMWSTT